tara:strand:+ start:2509 stop:3678 length:1170 start_codon:yes stop_codon:yes gene_type:complete
MGKVAAIGRDGRFMVNPSNHSESTTHYSKSYISEGVPVTDGLKVWLDADDWASYPGTKTMLGDWNDYGSNQDHYRTMGSDGVVLLGTSTNWIGRFIATTTATGNHTLVFDYWSDSSSSSFVLNNDGIMNNEWAETLTAETYRKTFIETVNCTSTGEIQMFIRNNTSGKNVYIDNVRFYKDDTTWYDLSGNGNHGTLTNGPTHTIPLAAHPTKGITLDGSDDWISNTSLDGGDTSFTIELWVYHNGTDQNASYGIYSGGRDQGPLIYHHGSGMGTGHYFPSSPGGDYPGGNSASAVNGDWTQIVHNYYNTHSSSSNLYKSYKNGVHVGSSTIDFHDSGHGRGTDGYALGSYSTGNNVYKGSYGIFKYYNRNLSDAEVMQNFNSERNRFGK